MRNVKQTLGRSLVEDRHVTDTIAEAARTARSDRFLAYLVDFLLLSAVAFALWVTVSLVSGPLLGSLLGSSQMSGQSGPDSATMFALLATSFLSNLLIWLFLGAVLVWYFVAYPNAEGQTVGKRLQDVAVVDESGDSATRRQRLIRTALLLLPFPLMALLGLLGAIGFVFALFLMCGWLFVEGLVAGLSDDARRIGDRVAGTYVVSADALAQ